MTVDLSGPLKDSPKAKGTFLNFTLFKVTQESVVHYNDCVEGGQGEPTEATVDPLERDRKEHCEDRRKKIKVNLLDSTNNICSKTHSVLLSVALCLSRGPVISEINGSNKQQQEDAG